MASAAAETVPPRISMAFDLFMTELNHGSMKTSTPVQHRPPTIRRMSETVWQRLEAVMGVKPLTVVAVRDMLGVSYQAAVKLKNGGGLSRDNNNKVAKKYGLNPDWLAHGKLPKSAVQSLPPPPAPASASGPFEAVTLEEQRFLDDFRRLLDSDRERYRSEISEKAAEMRKHMEKLIGNYKGKEKR